MNTNILQRIDKLIIIPAPVQCVYNQCSQFKEFSRFTPYVMSIRQYDDYPIRVQIWFREKRFKSQTEKFQPWSDEPIAYWGPGCRVHQGSITLECETGNATRVTVELDCAPCSPLGRTEGSPDAVEEQIEAILERFRNFIVPEPNLTLPWADKRFPGEILTSSVPETQAWTRY